MTKEQLAALETWIEAIIDDHKHNASIPERMRRLRLKEDVLKAFCIGDEK